MSDKQVQMDEQFIEKRQEQEAEKYISKFGSVIEEACDTYNDLYKGTNKEWTRNDTVALGSYLETWESYSKMFEADPTTRDSLGDYLKVGLGLVAIQYVALPATFFASIQPLADEVGVIYYRELVATMTRGAITQGDIIGSQQGKLSASLDDYYAEEVTKSTNVVSGTGTYNIALQAPVRPRTIEVTVTIVGGANEGVYRGIDDGNGFLIGNWPTPAAGQTGTINYTSGAVVVKLGDTGATSGTIAIKYHQNLAQAATIPGFHYQLASKATRVNYFVLSNEYSTLADFVVRKRFGMALTDDIAAAAVAQINSAVLTSMIRKLKAAAVSSLGGGTTTWSATPPDGVSVAEHRKTFPDALEAATQGIDAKTGRGAISFIIAGSFGRRILNTLGVTLVRKPLPGPYLAGFWSNIPVFYAPADLIDNDELIVGYRGPAWFEAPLVYGPFLPIVTVKGTGANVFNRIQGTAHAAAVDTVVPGFCAQIKITGMS